MSVIKIHRGFFANGVEFSNVVCPLVEPAVPNNPNITGIKGYPLTAAVNTSNTNLSRKAQKARIYFKNPDDFEVVEGLNASDLIPSDVDTRTDEEIAEIIEDKFESLTLLSIGASHLKIRAMIASGSPGTGKTYEVLKAMTNRMNEHRSFYYHHIKGTISPIALYIELYRARNGVLILDDSDECFMDPESIQLIKAATESNKERKICYRKLSIALEAEGIPQEFNFEGCVIILTNTDLENAGKSKAPHYDAIISRAHYINAVLATDREKLIRIRQVISRSNLLDAFLPKDKHRLIEEFVDNHSHQFRELSIRTVVKLAELCNCFPKEWQRLARGTLLTR
jgi:hypothetical protein